MTEHRARVLRIERTFDAPVERVFEAWTSEEVLRRWLHGMPGWETPTAEVDLRVGGRIRVVMRDPADGAESGASGEYRVVDPPHRLVFTWVWDDQPDQPQLIELEFSERDGRTVVLMTNSSIPTAERWESQQRGWNVCYDNLDRVLTG
ncbi:MAG: SRPBCC family protein [Gaiellaceae bacterium]